jgi:hypothetical protein
MKMNRRQFLYTIGTATAGIAGWVLLPESAKRYIPKQPAQISFCPRLAEDVIVKKNEGGGELLRPEAQGLQQIVCQVNEYGMQVVTGMDGHRTVQELAAIICPDCDSLKTARTEASVASFLAMLAQADLLAAPFFVDIHAVEVTA